MEKTQDKQMKGVNLGGWLLMEGYILRSRNIAETRFKNDFKKIYGPKELEKFTQLFRDNFITENDFKNIAAMGANVIRVPFNYKLIEGKPFVYSKQGFAYLDKVFLWANKYQLKVILDLHAACGAQNFDWHGDSMGKALLWEKELNRKRTCVLWQKIADRYKDDNALYAYDVLNEPVLPTKSLVLLEDFYKNVIKYIREVDKKTLIYLEGAIWSQQIDFLKPFISDNIGVSIHTYQPINYTFNFTPFYKYPGTIDGEYWNKQKMSKYIKPYLDFAKENKVKMLAGEFGVTWRGGHYGELNWLDDILNEFDKGKLDYTYWTYKAIANSCFPDGIYQYIANNQYICREGPESGWETYLKRWGKEKNNIVEVWRTKNYTPNKDIINVLKKHFSK